jgi:2-polyprenyl-3-methyl-5-hydroxy-6-metoxy-1,4-benzoquinol methylase
LASRNLAAPQFQIIASLDYYTLTFKTAISVDLRNPPCRQAQKRLYTLARVTSSLRRQAVTLPCSPTRGAKAVPHQSSSRERASDSEDPTGVLNRISDELGDKHYYNLQHRRYKWIIRQVLERIQPGGSVADIGAAPGHVSMALADLGYRVKAFDYAPDCDLWESTPDGSFASLLKKHGAELKHWDLEVLDPAIISNTAFDGQFDCVLFTEVLEHIYRYPFATVRQIAQLLKPGGLCIVTTPNRASLTSRLRAFFGISIGTKLELLKDNFPPHMRHVWLYTPSEVRTVLSDCKLEAVFTAVQSFHLWTTRISSREHLPYWRPNNLKQVLKPLLGLFLVLFPAFGETVCVIAKKELP